VSLTGLSLIVPWDTAATVMGDMSEPQGLYPERYLVKGFPSDEQMAEMKPVLDPGSRQVKGQVL